MVVSLLNFFKNFKHFFRVYTLISDNKSIKTKAQASMEYFIVVSIALLLLTPIIVLSQNTLMDMNEFKNALTLKQTINSIKNAADLVYAEGEPSSVVVSVTIPEKVENITCGNNYLDFRLYTIYGYNDYITMFPYNISCSFPLIHGKTKLRVSMSNGVVNIVSG